MDSRLSQSPVPMSGEIEFGPYRLTTDGELHCPDGASVRLTARLACVLSELASRNGAAVSRADLLDHCWPDETIEEVNLTRAIADLRKIFRAHGGDCIETLYGLGYRLNTGRSDRDLHEKISFCQEAWQRIYQRRRASLRSAEHLFTQIVSQDEGYLPAWLGLAETQIHSMQLCYTTTLESAPRAWALVDRALELDPASADALALNGLLLTWAEWDFPAADAVLKRACETDPNAYLPNVATASRALALGKFESAERHFRAASLAKPLAMTARAGLAFAHMYRGDDEAALKIAREMVQVDPYGPVALGLASIVEATFGDPAKAVSMAEKSLELLPESPVAGAVLACALARAGLAERARTLLESETRSGDRIGSNTMAAPAWMELGEAGAAIAALESGFANRCTWLPQMLSDPRIGALNVEPLRVAIYGQPIQVPLINAGLSRAPADGSV